MIRLIFAPPLFRKRPYEIFWSRVPNKKPLLPVTQAEGRVLIGMSCERIRASSSGRRTCAQGRSGLAVQEAGTTRKSLQGYRWAIRRRVFRADLRQVIL